MLGEVQVGGLFQAVKLVIMEPLMVVLRVVRHGACHGSQIGRTLIHREVP
jgi:hypothetical protein